MDINAKYEKKMAQLRVKIAKEEKIIELHKIKLEKFKSTKSEIETKEDNRLIKQFVHAAKKHGILINKKTMGNLLIKLTAIDNKTSEVEYTDKNQPNDDKNKNVDKSDAKQSEQNQQEKFVPQVPDAFK